MGKQLSGLAYDSRASLATKYDTWPKPENPTHCDQCKCPVNRDKALRRLAREYVGTNREPAPKMGRCACGNLIYYPYPRG